MWFSDRFAVVCSQLQQQDIVMLQRIVAIWCEVKPKFCVLFFKTIQVNIVTDTTLAGATSELVRAAATINSLSLPISCHCVAIRWCRLSNCYKHKLLREVRSGLRSRIGHTRTGASNRSATRSRTIEQTRPATKQVRRQGFGPDSVMVFGHMINWLSISNVLGTGVLVGVREPCR